MNDRSERFMRGTDAFSWYLEQDPGLRSTIVAVAWLDEAPDQAVLEARLERATRLAPRFRQRPVEPPLRLANPRWSTLSSTSRCTSAGSLRRVRGRRPPLSSSPGWTP